MKLADINAPLSMARKSLERLRRIFAHVERTFTTVCFYEDFSVKACSSRRNLKTASNRNASEVRLQG